MNKKLLKLSILLTFVFLPFTVRAYSELCPSNTPCCTPPQAIIDGGGCSSGKYWIGGVEGSCQTPTTCAAGTQFNCANNTCYTAPPGPTCTPHNVDIGTSAPCCTSGQAAIYNTTSLKWECGGGWIPAGANIYNSNYAGNVGIGTVTPGAKLDVNGLARVQGYVWPASGAGMEFAYNSANNLGLIQVYKRDAPAAWGKLYLGDGNVGIGTVTPGAKLEIAAPASGVALNVGRASGQPNIKGLGDWLILDAPVGGRLGLNYWETGNVIIAYGGGNVGIGTLSPTAKLSVAYASGQTGIESVGPSGNSHIPYSNGYVYLSGTGIIFRDDANSEKMRLADNGYLGIGTTSPAYALDVAGTANLNKGISGIALRVNGDEALWYNGSEFSWGYGGTSNYFADKIGIGMTPVYSLDVSGSIRASGNLYADYLKSYGSLSVDGKAYIYGGADIYGNVYSEASQSGGSIFIWQNTSTGADADTISAYIANVQAPGGGLANCFYKMFDGTYGGTSTKIGSICANTASSVAYYTTSDARLKTNIKDISDGLDTVMQMKPRLFEWKAEPGVLNTGFIAQELIKVMPEVVIGTPDSDLDTDPMSVDYSKLTPILTAAIQDQQKIIEDLKARIEVLEANSK
jgi:hypothetical protein